MTESFKLRSKDVVEALEELISTWRGLLSDYEYLRLRAISMSGTPAELQARDETVLELDQFQADLEQVLEELDHDTKWLRYVAGMPRRDLALRPLVPSGIASHSLQSDREEKTLDVAALREHIKERLARQAEARAAMQAVRQAIGELIPSPTPSLWSARLRFF